MNRIGTVVAMVGVACLGSSLTAGPLQRKDVPKDPAWVLHVDCDALKTTQLGKYILNELDKPEARDQLAAFQAAADFDVRQHLHGVTLYSASNSKDDAVLLAYADFNEERLVTLAKSAKEYQESTHRDHTIRSWIDDKKKPKNGVQPRTYAAIQGKRVIFSPKEGSLAAALDVLDGGANLGSVQTYAELGNPKNGFLQGAARKLTADEGDPSAALLRFSKEVRLQVNEKAGKVKAMVNLDASSEEVAQSLKSIAQGLVSLIKLHNNDKPENLKIAEAVALEQTGPTVKVNLELPASEVIEFIKKDAARKAARKAQANAGESGQ